MLPLQLKIAHLENLKLDTDELKTVKYMKCIFILHELSGKTTKKEDYGVRMC